MKMRVNKTFPENPLEEAVPEDQKKMAKKIDEKTMSILDELSIDDPTTEELSDAYRMAADEYGVELVKVIKKEVTNMNQKAEQMVKKVKEIMGKEHKVEVLDIRKNTKENNVLAFADIAINDHIVQKGYTVTRNSKSGEEFIQNPSQLGKDGNWHSRCYIRNNDSLKALVSETIMTAFKEKIAQ